MKACVPHKWVRPLGGCIWKKYDLLAQVGNQQFG